MTEIALFRPKLVLSAEILSFGQFQLSVEIALLKFSSFGFGRKPFGSSQLIFYAQINQFSEPILVNNISRDSAVPVAVPIAIAISISIAIAIAIPIAIPIAVRFGNGVSCSGLTFSHTLWWIWIQYGGNVSSAQI